jgi:WD40 repeat protein
MAVSTTFSGHGDSVYAVCFAPGGTRLISASRDRMAIVWRLDGAVEHWLPLPGPGIAVAVSSDSALVVVGCANGTITTWGLADGRRINTICGSALECLAFRPGRRELFVGGADGVIEWWDVGSGTRLGSKAIAGQGESILSLQFGGANRMLLAGCKGGRVLFVDERSLSIQQSVETGPAGSSVVYRCVASPTDGLCAASLHIPLGGSIAHMAPDRFEILVWDAAVKEKPDLARSLVGHVGWIGGLDFSPDGRLLASGSFDESVRLWDPHARKVVAELRGHDGAVYGLMFSPNGALLASCSADGTVRLWRVAEAADARPPSRSEPLGLEDVVGRMLDSQGPGRAGVLVVAQDIVEALVNSPATDDARETIRQVLVGADPATQMLSRAVCRALELRIEQARREGNATTMHRYGDVLRLVGTTLTDPRNG